MSSTKCWFVSLLWIMAICSISNINVQVLAQTTAKPKKDEVCEDLKKSQGSKLNIWAVGLLHNSLLVVTKDWFVYDLPMTNLDETLHKLYLTNGLPMSQKWPTLWNNEKFSQTKEKTMDTMMFVYPDRIVLSFVYFRKDGLGVDYDITNDQVNEDGWEQFDSRNLVFIATPEFGRFYSTLNKEGVKGIFIDKWKKIPDQHEIYPVDSYCPICWINKPNTIMIGHPGGSCQDKEPVEWSMCKGFISNNSFYLFGHTKVHVFPVNIYSSHSGGPLNDTAYSDFFMCPGEVLKDSHSSTLWWIILIILLLLLLLCLILFCVAYVYRKRNNKKRRWKPAQSMMSMRSGSGSNIGVGMLTKMFSTKYATTNSAAKTRRSGLSRAGHSNKKLSEKRLSKKKRSNKKKVKDDAKQFKY